VELAGTGTCCFRSATFGFLQNSHGASMENSNCHWQFCHLWRPRNFTIENKFSSEDFLANCHWQFSPSRAVPTPSVAPKKKPHFREALSLVELAGTAPASSG